MNITNIKVAILVLVPLSIVISMFPRPSYTKCVTFLCVPDQDLIALRDFGYPYKSIVEEANKRFESLPAYKTSDQKKVKFYPERWIFNVSLINLVGILLIFGYKSVKRKSNAYTRR